MGLGADHQWDPLVALRIEVVARINPLAARTMTILEGVGAFRFGILESALEAGFEAPPGTSAYVRSDTTYSPDHQMHRVPANRWVTLGFDHDGFSKMQLRIDGRIAGEAA